MAVRWKRWIIGAAIAVGAVVAAIVIFLIVWQLTHKADDRASEDFADIAGEAGGGVSVTSLDGTWSTITPAESDQFYVGYRVDEILFGQNVTATGRTDEVTGTLTFDGSTLAGAEFTAQLADVTSDQSRRDNQFRGRIMAVDEFPTATFMLTSPIEVASIPEDGRPITVAATGDLTLRGTTKSVTVDLSAVTDDGLITVTGAIPIVFDEWDIPEPSFGPATVEDHGEIEFLLTFAPTA